MRPRLLLASLLVCLAAFPSGAEPIWILQSGPEAVTSIPLDPVQPVTAWRGLYSDGEQSLWLYATRSPQFFPPQVPEVVPVPPTPWTVVAFFPQSWSPGARRLWLETWLTEFRTLSSLPDPGYPIVFPAILRKG